MMNCSISVVGLPVGGAGRLTAVLGLILTDPGSDAVVLIVVKELIQLHLIDRVGLGDAVDGQLAAERGGFHKVQGEALGQQIHVQISSKYVS